jgi:pyridoxamine 5'-phosphate oxidase
MASGMIEDPHALFDAWLRNAETSEPNDPNAMCLATVDAAGNPSARMVLLKGHDRGFVFYTNLGSRKAEDLAAHARAALLFHWKSLRRQVRIEGGIERVSDAEADAYFASRSRASQLGAVASEQSRPLASRETFLARYEEEERRWDGRDVPRPDGWGGFRLIPRAFEFWQDREHRLHERRVFSRAGEGWTEGLLYP